jgi:hypothetical protein
MSAAVENGTKDALIKVILHLFSPLPAWFPVDQAGFF